MGLTQEDRFRLLVEYVWPLNGEISPEFSERELLFEVDVCRQFGLPLHKRPWEHGARCMLPKENSGWVPKPHP